MISAYNGAVVVRADRPPDLLELLVDREAVTAPPKTQEEIATKMRRWAERSKKALAHNKRITDGKRAEEAEQVNG